MNRLRRRITIKLIIAGSRTLNISCNQIKDILSLHYLHPTDPDEIVSGGARGVDYSGELYADEYSIPVTIFPYKSELGKAGGPIRNKEMADYADALLLIWDGESRGSKNMKETMLKLNKPVYEVILRTHNIGP